MQNDIIITRDRAEMWSSWLFAEMAIIKCEKCQKALITPSIANNSSIETTEMMNISHEDTKG